MEAFEQLLIDLKALSINKSEQGTRFEKLINEKLALRRERKAASAESFRPNTGDMFASFIGNISSVSYFKTGKSLYTKSIFRTKDP